MARKGSFARVPPEAPPTPEEPPEANPQLALPERTQPQPTQLRRYRDDAARRAFEPPPQTWADRVGGGEVIPPVDAASWAVNNWVGDLAQDFDTREDRMYQVEEFMEKARGDTGEPGDYFGGTFGAERIEAVAVGEDWPQEVTDAVHGHREKLGEGYDLVQASPQGQTPEELIFESPDGDQYSVEYRTGHVTPLSEEQRTPYGGE